MVPALHYLKAFNVEARVLQRYRQPDGALIGESLGPVGLPTRMLVSQNSGMLVPCLFERLCHFPEFALSRI